jgi:hypothetical protein
MMRYAVTVAPEPRVAHPDVPPVNSILEASDKDAALDQAERAYRRLYPRVGRVRTSVMRIHPRD